MMHVQYLALAVIAHCSTDLGDPLPMESREER